jgi:tetratricopeptide (TPR) repeat protein
VRPELQPPPEKTNAPPPNAEPELDGALWLQIAARFEAKGEWRQAGEALDKAAFLMNGSPVPHLRRAWLWQRLGDCGKAREAADRAHRLAEQARDTQTLSDLKKFAAKLAGKST